MALQFRNTIFLGVAAGLEQCPPPDFPEIILSGRSNVGKSSLINALAENRQLARVSSMPGKTRLIVHFQVDRHVLLTDLPGYGFTGASKTSKAAYSSLADRYLNSGRQIILILHLLDIRHPPSVHDMQMLDWLKHHQLPCLVILTKSDKLSQAQIRQAKIKFAEMLGMPNPEAFVVFSSKTGQGVDHLRSLISTSTLTTPEH